MKALVGTFNQEKALGGLFSVIVKTGCETDGSFYSTTLLSSWSIGLAPHLVVQTENIVVDTYFVKFYETFHVSK